MCAADAPDMPPPGLGDRSHYDGGFRDAESGSHKLPVHRCRASRHRPTLYGSRGKAAVAIPVESVGVIETATDLGNCIADCFLLVSERAVHRYPFFSWFVRSGPPTPQAGRGSECRGACWLCRHLGDAADRQIKRAASRRESSAGSAESTAPKTTDMAGSPSCLSGMSSKFSDLAKRLVCGAEKPAPTLYSRFAAIAVSTVTRFAFALSNRQLMIDQHLARHTA